MRFLKILGFIYLLISSLEGHANEIRFHQLGTKDGLSHSLVSSMVEDSLGFLWFGTQEGLNRYDGYEFKKYFAGDGNRTLSKNWINQLYIDKYQQLWLYYQGGGIDRYDIRKDVFYKYTHSPEKKGGISSTQLEIIHMAESSLFYEDSEGTLWIGTQDGLNKYIRDSDSFIQYKNIPGNLNSISSNQITCLTGDDNGILWVGTNQGLNRFDTQSNTVQHFSFELSSNLSTENLIITSLLIDSAGLVWVGTMHNGVYVIEGANADNYKSTNHIYRTFDSNVDPTIYNIFESSAGKIFVGSVNGLYYYDNGQEADELVLIESTKAVRINLLTEDQLGNVWAGSRDGEVLFKIQKESNYEVVSINKNTKSKYTYQGEDILFIKQSSNGLLWLGAQKSGLYKIDVFEKKFKSISAEEDNPIHIGSPEVYSIYECPNNILYVGTRDKLSVVNLKNNTLKEFGGPLNIMNGFTYHYSSKLPAQLIGAIEPAGDGKIWLGAFDYKISLYDPVDESFLNFHQNEQDPKSFKIWSLRAILVSSRGDTYFGGTTNGLCKLLQDGKSFKYYPILDYDAIEQPGTNAGWINTLYESQDGMIWVGTLTEGLKRFDPNTETFRVFPFDTTYSSSENDVKCILEPLIFGDNILWIGTEKGLIKFDVKSGRFEKLYQEHRLLNKGILGILEDQKGRLWISTSKGIVFFDPITEISRKYEEEDGLLDSEFNEGAYFKNNDGIVYFGGVNGITYFDPDEIKFNPFESQTLITQFNLFNKPVNVGDSIDSRVVLKESISHASEIYLSYKDKIFSIEFASNHMVLPNKVRYRYKLEGFEEGWNEVGANQRFANYTNIPSGKYSFKVFSCNNDGVWNHTPKELSILIKPPFWQTIWFKVLLIVGMFFLLLVSLQLRLRVLKGQKEELKRKVAVRTQQLEEAYEQINLRQEEILAQSEKISNQNRDLSQQNKKLEDQKEEIQIISRKLHESDQMKLNFFTNISHEFKTPLTLIMGPTEKLLEQREYSDTNAVKDYLSLMYKYEKRLYRLISQLLEIRRIESNIQSLSLRKSDIIWFAFEIHELFRPFSDKRDIDFRFYSDRDSFEMFFDADKIEKILYNLLSNAFKHTPIGGAVSLSIETKKERNGDPTILLQVVDNGSGIDEEHLPHIFDRFNQISGKSEAGQISSGIGLSLCYDLVKVHKGEIEVRSTVSVGTTFSVFIPAFLAKEYGEKGVSDMAEVNHAFDYLKSMMENPDYAEGVLSAGEPSIKSSRPKLLIVEDNEDLLDFLTNEFRYDYDVARARNGQEGILMAHENLPDLIVSDVMMPIMDGITFCSHIKEDQLTSHIPVFLLTAKSELENQISGLMSKADDYILKPFSSKVLRLKIQNALQSRSQLAAKFSNDLDTIPENVNISEIDKGFLEKFVSYVEQNIDDPSVSGDTLANELNISKGNLYKKLKSLTGLTVNIYIRTIRLKVAARLLRNGNFVISEVAYSVGFSNPKYFSTCFSELFGISPKEYMTNSRSAES